MADSSRSLSQEYKDEYEITFTKDSALGRKYMPEIDKILDDISDLPASERSIINHEGASKNREGTNRSVIRCSKIAVRIRRNFALRHDEFTQDDKEREAMGGQDVYVLGYENKAQNGLAAILIWDGHDYEMQRDGPNIPIADRRQNVKHSRVWFNAYRNADIIGACKVYHIDDPIGSRPGLVHTKKVVAQLNLKGMEHDPF